MILENVKNNRVYEEMEPYHMFSVWRKRIKKRKTAL
jgi:hypothetical protein